MSAPVTGEAALLVSRDGPVVRLTLNRPAVLNALNRELLDALGAALDAIEADDTVRVVVLAASGRAFCAGADLKFVDALVGPAKAEATMRFLEDASATMTRLERLACPVIAAVNGIATAGGMELVLCCDLVIAAETARFGDGHANYGLLPGAGASARLPRRIGLTRANHLFFTGDLVPAEAMRAAGLVNKVVAADALDEAANALAGRIAVKSPVGLAAMKRLAAAALDRPLDEALAAELDANRAYLDTSDRAEGLAAFNEGRAPVFTGR